MIKYPNRTELCAALLSALLVATAPPVYSQTACVNPPQSLVSWWRAESNFNNAGNALTPKATTGVSFTAGKVGSAFQFGGASKIELGDPECLAFTNSFTIESWIWISTLPSPSQNHSQILFRGDTRFCLDPYYFAVSTSGALQFHIEDEQGLYPCGITLETSPVSLGQWTHVAAVFDSESKLMQIFVDGRIAAQQACPIRPFKQLQGGGVSIGNHSIGNVQQPFLGYVDELAIYGRALLPAEIQSIYAAGGAGKCVSLEGSVINVDFGGGDGTTSKTGLAATGRGITDFWNAYTRNGANGEWRTFGALTALKDFAGNSTGMGMTVANAPGAWGNNSSDPMYFDYIYPFNGGNVTVTLSNVPPGSYDLYAYGNNSSYKLSTGTNSYGPQLVYDPSPASALTWTPGRQYALFQEVQVKDGTMVLTVLPGNDGYAIISGLQIVRNETQPPPSATRLINLDFNGADGSTTKTGLAATGVTATDFWNAYTRNGPNGEWRTFGALTALKAFDGTSTGVGVTVANAPGAWGNKSPDPMYFDYIYPFNGGNVTVTFTNVPFGFYNLYVYGNNSSYKVTTGTNVSGPYSVFDPTPTSLPVWTPGKQFALFREIEIANGTLVLTVLPGTDGYAIISGLQLEDAFAAPIAPAISLQPHGQTLRVGSVATFSVGATGTQPLSYQWRHSGTNMPNATNRTFTVSVSVAASGAYSVLVTNIAGSVLSSNAELTVITEPTDIASLINVDFGGGDGTTFKTGTAATGVGTTDFWNAYTRNGPNGEWRTFGALTALKAFDGIPTGIGMTVANAPGAWGNTSPDPMYFDYIYPFNGGNVTVTFTNVPPGIYDLYAYGNNSSYKVVSGNVAFGPHLVYDPTPANVPTWTAGKQYAFFPAIEVKNGTVILTVLPGNDGYAIISGLQLVRKNVQPPLAVGRLIDVDFGGTSMGKTGFAATGRTATDFWNFYTRDDASGNWRTFGWLTNLKYVDGTVSPAGLTIANAPGAWADGSTDPMYYDYLYPLGGGNVTVTITNLPSGQYNFYIYSPDGNHQLRVSTRSYGTQTTFDWPVSNPPIWKVGKELAVFAAVQVGNNETVTLTITPGRQGLPLISGIQIEEGSATPVPPGITRQPQGQTLRLGSVATFSVEATGTQPLSYQWRHSGTNLPNATSKTLTVSASVAASGTYSVLVTNIAGSVLSGNADLTVITEPTSLATLINVDFGGGNGTTTKTGPAATGVASTDFWNAYTRNGPNGEWRTFGALPALKAFDGTATSVGMTVANAPGAWGNNSPDPMYFDYIYPSNGGNITVTLTNVPPGFYDLYAYGDNSSYTTTTGTNAYGPQLVYDPAPSNVPVWTDGRQYAYFRSIQVNTGIITLTVLPGSHGYAIISGLQLRRSREYIPLPTPTTLGLIKSDVAGDLHSLKLSNSSGRSAVVVYESMDMVNWVPILTNRPSMGPVEIQLPKRQTSGPVFYRTAEFQ